MQSCTKINKWKQVDNAVGYVSCQDQESQKKNLDIFERKNKKKDNTNLLQLYCPFHVGLNGMSYSEEDLRVTEKNSLTIELSEMYAHWI